MGMLRIAGLVEESIVDGPGFRFTVFTQGCPHACAGCHNAHTHDFAGGYEISIDTLLEKLDKHPLVSGVTLSGGEPFCQPAALLEFVQGARARGKHIIIYSGYTLEQILQLGDEQAALLRECDLLIDGKYDEKLRDLTLLFRGSANQRVLDIAASLAEGKAVWAAGY